MLALLSARRTHLGPSGAGQGCATVGSGTFGVSGTVTFAAGETSKTITVTVKGDWAAGAHDVAPDGARLDEIAEHAFLDAGAFQLGNEARRVQTRAACEFLQPGLQPLGGDLDADLAGGLDAQAVVDQCPFGSGGTGVGAGICS